MKAFDPDNGMSEIVAKAWLTEVAAARRAAIEECERIVRRIRYGSSRQAEEAADAIAKLKDTP